MSVLSKHEVFEQFLKSGIVSVVFDADHPDVVMPDYLEGPQMVELGHNMEVPIPDLTATDEEGITATLSFDHIPFWCSIPWSAVSVLSLGMLNSVVWNDVEPVAATDEPTGVKPRPSHLSVVR